MNEPRYATHEAAAGWYVLIPGVDADYPDLPEAPAQRADLIERTNWDAWLVHVVREDRQPGDGDGLVEVNASDVIAVAPTLDELTRVHRRQLNQEGASQPPEPTPLPRGFPLDQRLIDSEVAYALTLRPKTLALYVTQLWREVERLRAEAHQWENTDWLNQGGGSTFAEVRRLAGDAECDCGDFFVSYLGHSGMVARDEHAAGCVQAQARVRLEEDL